MHCSEYITVVEFNITGSNSEKEDSLEESHYDQVNTMLDMYYTVHWFHV
jgi:hypothetical protein